MYAFTFVCVGFTSICEFMTVVRRSFSVFRDSVNYLIIAIRLLYA